MVLTDGRVGGVIRGGSGCGTEWYYHSSAAPWCPDPAPLPRYRLLSDAPAGDVSLSILSSRQEDSGFYHCRVQVPGLFNDHIHKVHLIITQGQIHNGYTRLVLYVFCQSVSLHINGLHRERESERESEREREIERERER